MANHDTHDHTGVPGVGGSMTTKDEGSTLSTTVTALDFVGAGVTASGAGATTTITIPGGGTAPPEMVQWKNPGAGNTGLSLTMDITPTSGNKIFLFSFSNGNADLTSVTQTNVTWTKVASGTAVTSTKLNIWVGAVAASAGTTVTIVRGGGGGQAVWSVMEFTGLTLTPTGGTPVSSGIGSQQSVPAVLAPTTAGHLIAFAAGSVSQSLALQTTMSVNIPATGITVGTICGAIGYSLGHQAVCSAASQDTAGISQMVVEIT